jgi:hypothetical protein
MYSNQELANMCFMYGLMVDNAVVARLCWERNPGWSCLDRKTFLSIHSCLCEYGNFSCCQQGMTKIYDSWSRWGYSGCYEVKSWKQHTKGINACGCCSFDCVVSVARTAAVSLPCAACANLVTTRLPCMSNVLLVILTRLLCICDTVYTDETQLT